ncbi:methyltransferase [Dysgonomonas sp. HDW5A]|uniref:tRNA1(Val) (adenine(37)-N6)-methyltransferase n=1 Tax=Dysgonomonas sp. HDW5A TaxID=2714926 RepID=UPI00140E883E|nr:methyltransferase [Dysgonomonas sp. HDW5A]QIK60798.1 methyltransferase [Dysgonomonas sp. HDW5A]
MSNPYFSFKKFTVYHDICAMKVGTDGVLLGAWVKLGKVRRVLDVGTGTGLIALMLSQRSEGFISIDAIDIDEDAVLQTSENVERASFQNVKAIHSSLQDYVEKCDAKYDMIVSNPPYFSSSLHSPDGQRTLARHTNSLPMVEFMNISARLLSSDGYLSLIFPYAEKDVLIGLAENAGLFVSRITNVYPMPHLNAKRVLLEFSKVKQDTEIADLIIEKERHVYTDDFTELVKDFYLKL